MIGKLRHRVTFQKNVPARVKGVATDQWGDVAEVYAQVRTLRGTERPMGDQKESVVTHEVWTRFRPSFADQLEFIGGGTFEYIGGGEFDFLIGAKTLTVFDIEDEAWQFIGGGDFYFIRQDKQPKHPYRIKFGTKFFEIRSVLNPDPRKEYTVMRVEEVVT